MIAEYVFCSDCDKRILNLHGNSKRCPKCKEMLNKGFVRRDEYVNSEAFHGERWSMIGINSSMEAMQEVHQMFKTR